MVGVVAHETVGIVEGHTHDHLHTVEGTTGETESVETGMTQDHDRHQVEVEMIEDVIVEIDEMIVLMNDKIQEIGMIHEIGRIQGIDETHEIERTHETSETLEIDRTHVNSETHGNEEAHVSSEILEIGKTHVTNESHKIDMILETARTPETDKTLEIEGTQLIDIHERGTTPEIEMDQVYARTHETNEMLPRRTSHHLITRHHP